jgi:hypothetical protein
MPVGHGFREDGHRGDDEKQTRSVCANCRDILGVYEPIWIELTDGTLRSSSLLNISSDTPSGESCTRMWHLDCLDHDAIPAPRPDDDRKASV